MIMVLRMDCRGERVEVGGLVRSYCSFLGVKKWKDLGYILKIRRIEFDLGRLGRKEEWRILLICGLCV